jgi:UDP-GlcNAc:undecaprenyl-phosphate GlcNAc-1-phosphate transferase
MFAVGFWDDLQPLGAKKKLLAQVVIAATVNYFGLRIEQVSIPFTHTSLPLGSFSVVATVIWLVSLTNLINLIDGLDGLATGISLMLMSLLVYVGYTTNSFPVLAVGVTGSLVGFLIFNFPPAKIHLGDGGAYFLGFLIGELTIANSHKGAVVAALIAPLFVLALPILDVSLTIMRRGIRGLPLFRADRNHLHHRLLELGLSRRRAVLLMYGFTVLFLLLGLVAFRSRLQMLPLFQGLGMLVLLLAMSRMKFSQHWFNFDGALRHSLRMREDVAYAMTLTRWLHLEGRRVDSTEEFWKLLQFAAERLGFCQIRVRLEDGERTWTKNGSVVAGEPLARFDFRAGGAGIIEFQAGNPAGGVGSQPAAAASGDRRSAAGLEDERTFRVISELLAESWHKASLQKCERTGVALRFSPAAPPPLGVPSTAQPDVPLG